jgi:transketolase
MAKPVATALGRFLLTEAQRDGRPLASYLSTETREAVAAYAIASKPVPTALLEALLAEKGVRAFVEGFLFDAMREFYERANPFFADSGLPAIIKKIIPIGSAAVLKALDVARDEFEKRLEPELKKFLGGFTGRALDSVKAGVGAGSREAAEGLASTVVGFVLNRPVSELAGDMRADRIDGAVAPWFIDDTPKRFAACGWNVIANVDGHDVAAVDAAIAKARQADKPTLICCKTAIGRGSPNRAGTAKAHGEALGAEEIKLTREALAWGHEPFVIPEQAYEQWDARHSGLAAETKWVDAFEAYGKAHPQLALEYVRRVAGDLPKNFAQVAVDAALAAHTQAATVASRKASQMALESFTKALPELLGGSADLTGSVFTNTSHTPALRFDAEGASNGGRHINYGVREFGMAAVMNGVALHGGFIPYGGTFLTFSDYSRNALRMAALMKLRVVHVFTHDSIGLGEDGPTHQSVEHTASLRLMPGLDVWRPADTAETAIAWACALENRQRPTALILSRHNLPYAPKSGLDDISKGGYVLAEPSEVGLKKKAQAVIIATGSEVSLALHAQQLLAAKKVAVRVVSMPSTSVFDRQSRAYQASVMLCNSKGRGVPRIAVEMGVTDGWWKYGCAAVVGIDTYGESAPAPVLFKHFGFTAENVAATVLRALRG